MGTFLTLSILEVNKLEELFEAACGKSDHLEYWNRTCFSQCSNGNNPGINLTKFLSILKTTPYSLV